MEILALLTLSCSTCQFMIDFRKNTQVEFSSKCPYRDSVENVACLKHTLIQEYIAHRSA